MLISIGLPACTKLQGRSGVGGKGVSIGSGIGVLVADGSRLLRVSIGLGGALAMGCVFTASSVTLATEVRISADSSKITAVGVKA